MYKKRFDQDGKTLDVMDYIENNTKIFMFFFFLLYMYKKRFEQDGETLAIINYVENNTKNFCVFPLFIALVQETI
jgi:uncharacterized protein YkuJ